MLTWKKYRRRFGWVNRLPPRLVVAVATLGPIGRWGPAPGTNGSLVGTVFFFLVYPWLPPAFAMALMLISVYLAVVFCDAAEIILGEKDPGYVILDEFVAMPFCFLPLLYFLWSAYERKLSVPPALLFFSLLRQWPWLWLAPLFGFAFFRLFDIAKPFGIRRLQNLPGGLGVVVDDLAAALATSLVTGLLELVLLWYFFLRFFWES
jgi:phosphatidylglycerophosphatase A